MRLSIRLFGACTASQKILRFRCGNEAAGYGISMMNGLCKFFLGSLVLAWTIGPVHAAAGNVKAWPCNGCSNAQMANVATSASTGLPRTGRKYVYNMNSGVIKSYYVSEESDGAPGQKFYVAMPTAPEGWVSHQFGLLHQFYVNNGGSFTATISVDANSPSALRMNIASPSATGGYVNAYDVVNSSQVRNQVANEIASNAFMSFTSAMATLGKAIQLQTPGGSMSGGATALTVVVEFPDDSRAIYVFDWDQKNWDYMPDSAIDSHGNTIPETIEDFSNSGGRYDFSGPGNPNDISDFLYRARQAGVRITDGTRWACSAVPGAVSCVPY